MKPVIGLIPLYDDEKESYWMLPGYMELLECCGALPLMLPLSQDPSTLDACLTLCDGLLMTGGHDVAPALYGAAASPLCGSPCLPRDSMEGYLFQKAILLDMPVLGICRGIQLMNALLGGTLYQDLPAEHPSPVEHHMSPPYDRGIHSVTVLADTPLAAIIGAGEHMVNSYHHQAIQTLAPPLRSMALSEDGLVEAVCLPEQSFIMGLQWHPEFSYLSNPESMAIGRAFVAQCADYHAKTASSSQPL